MLRRLEFRGDCIARNPDTEFLRIISGTGQIAEAIKDLVCPVVKKSLAFLSTRGRYWVSTQRGGRLDGILQ